MEATFGRGKTCIFVQFKYLNNIVFPQLDSARTQQIFYLRKSRDYEIDFVITDRTHVQELIQVTCDFREPGKRLYNREIGGLLKSSKKTGCTNLTLIMMEGESRDIEVEGKTVHCVSAVDWLLGKNRKNNTRFHPPRKCSL